jgi:F0F1-type ATP synthase membrane subunit b/b'
LLISFSLFIIVAYRGVNKMIADMWDDTALKIKTELDSFKEIQKETLELLISKQKERKLIATQISEIFSFAKSESEVLVELSKKINWERYIGSSRRKTSFCTAKRSFAFQGVVR